MSTLIKFIASLAAIVGFALIFGINPSSIENAIMSLFINKNIKDEVGKTNKQNIFKKSISNIGKKLEYLKLAMEKTHRKGYFSYACFISVALMIVAIFIGSLLENIVLGFVLGMIFCLIPFQYLEKMIQDYKNSLTSELEMGLNIITMSYIRSGSIVTAVNESLENLKSPVKDVFEKFVNDITYVDPDIKKAIIEMKDQTDNAIFMEWCDNLILCQDEADQRFNLLNIVKKYSDQKIINGQLRTMLTAPKAEFWTMAGFLVGNIGLLYITQDLAGMEWFHFLWDTIGGKIVMVISSVIMFIAMLLMLKFTKPIEYEN